MATFICAVDESLDQNPIGRFFFGGFSAPESDWNDYFIPAWQERVLNGPPRMDSFHATEWHSSRARRKLGLTWLDAQQRLDEASRVIESLGSLVPVVFSLDAVKFQDLLGQRWFQLTPKSRDRLRPDYICYQWMAYSQLHCLAERFGEAVEKVNFMVEKNGKTTRRMACFHDDLSNGLRSLGQERLIPLIGSFVPVDKSYIPTQAADYLTWLNRKRSSGGVDGVDLRRFERMVKGRQCERFSRFMDGNDLGLLAAALGKVPSLSL